ncbi:MAG: iron ABC transporter permease [Spirochaetes bacterium]|nr:iron ABC transporter permease [Spirochaetota bacterium]
MIIFFIVVIAGVSFFLGAYPTRGLISLKKIIDDPLAQRIVLYLRLPRILTALLAGMVLAASGNVFQMIFANPLVEPGFLGVSQGAAFGAALGIIFLPPSPWLIQMSAAVFSLSGLFLSFILAKRFHFGGFVLRLLLAGIAVSALFSAGIGFIKYLADPMKDLPEITFWMLGDLSSMSWERFFSILPPVLVTQLILLLMRWRINLLTLDDRASFSLGIKVNREKILLLVCAVISTATIVSVAGIIGWVGLIIPHISRHVIGMDSRYSLPASMGIGAGFMLICDDLARLLSKGEIPLGILTSFVGAIIFIYLLGTQKIEVHR